MAMGGASGQQASVIVVRGLATGDILTSDTFKRLLKEFKISLLNALLMSIISFLIIYLWESLLFASILSLSMFIVINTSNLAGSLLPFLFKKFKIDPALASAPFIATANDIFGLLIYLSILTLGLGLFG
jgi:magnesium transporter